MEKSKLILYQENKVDDSRPQQDTNKKYRKLDYFTSKDIQDENKEITRIFQKEALNYINDDEETENETIGQFLKGVALISRRAHNTSNELFIKMFQEFSEFEEKEITISNLENDEQLKKEFSSWVKEFETTPEGKQKYDKYFNQFKGEGTLAKEKYTPILFSQLTKLYFHCELSFPIVDVDFNDIESGMPFNHEKMIDFINKGRNRKVNFVILPSLFSNGNYLENGKSWVFTYKKDTFCFSDSKLNFENIDDKKEIFKKLLSQHSQNRENIFLEKQTSIQESSDLKEPLYINYIPSENDFKYYRCSIAIKLFLILFFIFILLKH